jgi:hypothetical protein
MIAERLSSRGPAPRVLIVGSADTGQVAAVANALAGRDFSLSLVDICSTPLKLCATFAARNGIPLDTHKGDVRNVAGLGKFDAILLHNFINFISADDRVMVLSELRRALTDQGRLLLFQQIYSLGEEDNVKAPDLLVADILEAMRVRNIALPESRAVFAARIHADLISGAREKRRKVFKTAGDVEALLREAGFHHVVATVSVAAERNKGPSWRPPNTRYLFEAC